MSKDILKDFVDKNRSDFDDASPSVDVFAKIQAQLASSLQEKEAPVPEMSKAKIIRFRYWWAAAAMLLVVFGLLFFFQNKEVSNSISPMAKTKINPSKAKNVVTDSLRLMIPQHLAQIENKMSPSAHKGTRSFQKKNKIVEKNIQAETLAVAEYSEWSDRLKDSMSSSDRLATVLEMGKVKHLSSADLKLLANTMNHDESSNVRLAALDALSAQPYQENVKPLIMHSITHQDDPIVQMELLSKLSPAEAKKAKKQLIEISQNPLNIDAVRDQAYVALLRSKSNF